MAKFCKHYGDCGGCDFQEMEYAGQLEYKYTYCKNLLASFGRVPLPIVASPQERHFRNKMEFAVSGTSQAPVIGQRRKERFDQIIDLAECRVFSPLLAGMAGCVRAWIGETGTQPYDFRGQHGEFRYLSLRHSKSADQYMAAIVVNLSEEAFAGVREGYRGLAGRLAGSFPVRSVYACLNAGRSDTALAGTLVLLRGEDHLVERVNDVEYFIRPQTFFQTNSGCCGRLYAAIADCAAMLDGHIYDVYCGSGGITLQLANAGRSVSGIDVSQRNIEDARENCRHNGLSAEFICQDADAFIQGLSGDRPWSLIVDPPRNGLTGTFIDILNTGGPSRFVYVSCNPLKLREDLKKLTAYALIRVIPVDMFPHTRHMEVVALLERATAA